jgi:hypothetical protein
MHKGREVPGLCRFICNHGAVRGACRPEPLVSGAVSIWHCSRQEAVMLGTILIIVLVLVLLGALPTWPYSSGWGYYPSGGLGLILVIIIILVLLGRF